MAIKAALHEMCFLFQPNLQCRKIDIHGATCLQIDDVLNLCTVEFMKMEGEKDKSLYKNLF